MLLGGRVAGRNVNAASNNNSVPAISILGGAPSLSQIAAGSLYSSNGVAVSCTRASSKLCRTGATLDPAQFLVNPERFNTTSWSQQSPITVADLAGVDPGESNAATLVTTQAGSSTQKSIFQTPLTLPSGVYTMSLYVKAGTSRYFGLNHANSQSLTVDMVAGTISNVVNFTASSITSAGNGWWRITATTPSQVPSFFVLMFSETLVSQVNANGGISPLYTSVGGYTTWIFGARLQSGSTATAYSFTNGNNNQEIITLSNNQISVEPNGILVETAATNLLLQSNSIGISPWSGGGASGTLNAAIAPDGTSRASLWVKPNSSQFQVFAQAVTLAATTQYTISCYIKASTSSQCQIALYDGNSFMSGATGRILSGPGTIKLCDNGLDDNHLMWVQGLSTTQWTRISITVTTNSTTGQNILFYPDTQHSSTSGAGNYYWGCQIEAGPVATSLIPTTTAQATRAADVITLNGIALSHTPSWSCDFIPYSATNGTQFLMQLQNSATDRWETFVGGSGLVSADYFNGSGFTTTGAATVTAYTSHHAAASYDGANLRLLLDGVEAKSARSFTSSATTYNLAIGRDVADSASPFCGWISNIFISKTPAGAYR